MSEQTSTRKESNRPSIEVTVQLLSEIYISAVITHQCSISYISYINSRLKFYLNLTITRWMYVYRKLHHYDVNITKLVNCWNVC